MKQFADLALPGPIDQALKAMNFLEPTPIQAQAIPLALDGKDLIGCAQTGTGKTAAFSIPILKALLENPEINGLVLAPTRELVAQIALVWRDLTRFAPQIQAAVLIGGAPMQPQRRALQKRPRLIIATPGRLVDHLHSRTCNLDRTHVLVLDEADRMLDMGFAPQLNEILRFLPKERQNFLFTATWDKALDNLARRYTQNPERVTIGVSSRAASTVEQQYMYVSNSSKNESLLDELNTHTGSTLVFTRTQIRTDKVARFLERYGVNVGRIHGGRSQAQRNSALDSFRRGRTRVLVATDIAARGIDVSDIKNVINFDLPRCAEDYIHRIGRTGRNGETGVSLSFLTNEDRGLWKQILRLLSKSGSAEPKEVKPAAERKQAAKKERQEEKAAVETAVVAEEEKELLPVAKAAVVLPVAKAPEQKKAPVLVVAKPPVMEEEDEPELSREDNVAAVEALRLLDAIDDDEDEVTQELEGDEESDFDAEGDDDSAYMDDVDGEEYSDEESDEDGDDLENSDEEDSEEAVAQFEADEEDGEEEEYSDEPSDASPGLSLADLAFAKAQEQFAREVSTPPKKERWSQERKDRARFRVGQKRGSYPRQNHDLDQFERRERPFGEKRSFGGERRDSSEGRSFGDKGRFNDRREGFNERREGFGNDRRGGFNDRRGPRRDFGDRRGSFGGQRDFSERRNFGERREFGERRDFGARRDFGGRRDFNEGRGPAKQGRFDDRRGFGENRGREGRPFGEDRRGPRPGGFDRGPRRFDDRGRRPEGRFSRDFGNRGPGRSDDRPRRFDRREEHRDDSAPKSGPKLSVIDR